MTAVEKIHVIEAAEIPERYARGWHVIGKDSDFTNTPIKLNYFGASQVAYRGESGEVYVMDAFCPHMGGNLAEGEVKGNSIVCPFHHWSWGSDGICDHIPYADSIPRKASIKSWPTLEENGLVFVWNDPQGNPPIDEQRPERMDDFFSAEWTGWEIATMTIETNCRELVDNMADVAHFGPIHFAPIRSFKNICEAHTYTQVLTSGHEILTESPEDELYSCARYEGPAYMTTYMKGSQGGEVMEVRLLVSHVPINTESFDLRFGVMVKKNPNLTEADNTAICDQYIEANREAFFQDVQVWHSKCRVDNPVLCAGDGPIHKVRSWYKQFYMDIAEVPDALRERKEYVVDYKLRD